MIFSASRGLSLCQCSKDVLTKSLFAGKRFGTGEQRQGDVWRERTVGETDIDPHRFGEMLVSRARQGVGREGIPRLHCLEFVKIVPFSLFSHY